MNMKEITQYSLLLLKSSEYQSVLYIYIAVNSTGLPFQPHHCELWREWDASLGQGIISVLLDFSWRTACLYPATCDANQFWNWTGFKVAGLFLNQQYENIDPSVLELWKFSYVKKIPVIHYIPMFWRPFIKEGEPSRTVNKSCITDPPPRNRAPVQPDSMFICTRNVMVQFCAFAK